MGSHMPYLDALVPCSIIYGLQYRHYKKKSNNLLKGFPGVIWTYVGCFIVSANVSLSMNALQSMDRKPDSGVIAIAFVLCALFCLLGNWKLRKAVRKLAEAK